MQWIYNWEVDAYYIEAPKYWNKEFFKGFILASRIYSRRPIISIWWISFSSKIYFLFR